MAATDAPERSDRAFLAFGAGDSLPHLPALDGLRGLAVTAVVLFHGNWAWARGGFLGVSLFFTLSGFLITSLLIDEHRRTGAIDLAAFWGRRFRASFRSVADARAGDHCRGRARRVQPRRPSRRLVGARQRGQLAIPRVGQFVQPAVRAASPVRHFWSLAIEEQCYLVVPLVAALALRWRRHPRLALAAALGGLTAASIVSTVMGPAPTACTTAPTPAPPSSSSARCWRSSCPTSRFAAG